MTELRAVGSVANLPTTVYGHRSPMWWGTLAFIIIEGSTLFICAMSYFYIQQNFPTWPPEHIVRPALAAAGLQAALMLVSNVPMVMIDRAARRMDLPVVQRGMVLMLVLCVAMCVLRWFELQAVHVRWDSSAYGSVVWATLVTHSTLLLLQAAETLVMALLLYSPNLEQRDLSGVTDSAVYWYFMTGVWIPLAAIVFLSPYVM